MIIILLFKFQSIVDIEGDDNEISDKQISGNEVIDINEDNIVPIFLTKEQKKRKALKVLQKERDELQQKDKEIFGVGNSDFFKERDKSNPLYILIFIYLNSSNIVSTITLQPANGKWNNNITYYYYIDISEINNNKPIEMNIVKAYRSKIVIDESYWINQRDKASISSAQLYK